MNHGYALILMRKNIKAKNLKEMMKIVKTKFPYAKRIKYKTNKDKTMSIAFVDDYRKIEI